MNQKLRTDRQCWWTWYSYHFFKEKVVKSAVNNWILDKLKGRYYFFNGLILSVLVLLRCPSPSPFILFAKIHSIVPLDFSAIRGESATVRCVRPAYEMAAIMESKLHNWKLGNAAVSKVAPARTRECRPRKRRRRRRTRRRRRRRRSRK